MCVAARAARAPRGWSARAQTLPPCQLPPAPLSSTPRSAPLTHTHPADAFVESSPGYYRLRYRRSPPSFTAARFAAAVATAAGSAFAALPTAGDFDDDAYWAGVARAAAAGETVVYPSDIHASVLRDVADFPAGWNMALFDDKNDLLRAL